MVTVIKFKSITSLRPCEMIFLFVCLTVLISMHSTVANEAHTKIITDLPVAKDIDEYLTPLEKIIEFCVRHKLYIDLNFEFGLFLVNVNLRTIFKKKSQDLPPKIRYRLEQLLTKNDVVNDYFHYMVKRTEENIAYEKDRKIQRLFFNETYWPKYVQRFNLALLEKTKIYTPEQLVKIYGKYELYETNVQDFEKYKPTPSDSDSCMATLADNPPAGSHKLAVTCQAPKQCKEGIHSGSEFGYGLSHRLLFLVLSRFARGCSVFSLKEDKYKMDKFCMRAFNEAQYIASNNYKQPDLMMEQIALCTLIGHAQFLQQTWIKKLLHFQTSEGCFTEDEETLGKNEMPMEEAPGDEWTLSSKMQIMMNGACNGHITAVAAAVLASVLRYILENNF